MLATTESIDVGIRELVSGGSPDEPFPEFLLDRTGFGAYQAVQSGRAGLRLALEAAGVESGQEVVIPAYSCLAVREAVEAVGQPVYADVSMPEYNVDVDSIAEKLSPATRAVVPVHAYGKPCDMEAIAALAAERDCAVIEDACQAVGNTVLDTDVGRYSDYCVFSFRFFKDVTAFHGGLVLRDSAETAATERMRTARPKLAGVSAATTMLNRLPGRLYEPLRRRVLAPASRDASGNVDSVRRVELTDWQRSVLGAQCQRLEERVRKRRVHARSYNRWLPDAFGTPTIGPGHSLYRYPVQVPARHRDALVRRLRRRGVGCSTMYAYTLPDDDAPPESRRAASETVLLPVHAGLSDAVVERIARITTDEWERVR